MLNNFIKDFKLKDENKLYEVLFKSDYCIISNQKNRIYVKFEIESERFCFSKNGIDWVEKVTKPYNFECFDRDVNSYFKI